MGTMGIRAVLAGAFLLAAGALGGVEAWPAGPAAGAGEAVPRLAPGQAVPAGSLLSSALVRTCELALAAQRRDHAAAATRRQECERRHAGASGRRP